MKITHGGIGREKGAGGRPGTGEGIEVLFCGTGAADWDWENYDRCTGAAFRGSRRDPAGGRSGAPAMRGSCSTLFDGRVLIDCGTTGFRALVRWGVDPRKLREVWFTHSHPDHCSPTEVGALLDARGPGAAALVLRGTPPLLDRLVAALGKSRETGRFVLRPIEPLVPFRTRGWLATPLPANHLTPVPGERPVHFLVRAPQASFLYALDGAWMTAAARRAIGSAPLDLVVWDATVESPGDWRMFEHNDLGMVRAMTARLAKDGVVRKGTALVLDHVARTLWRAPVRAPRPFRMARDGMRIAIGSRGRPQA